MPVRLIALAAVPAAMLAAVFTAVFAVSLVAAPAAAASCPPPPNVTGQTYEQAYALLNGRYGYAIVTVPDPAPAQTNYVISAETLSCIEFKITNVRVVLGGRVPDLSGMTLTAATAAVDAAGFGLSAQPPQATGEWTVRRQTPEAGSLLPYGQPVTLELDGSTEVPYIIGLTVAEARERLAEKGLTLGGAGDARDGQVVEDQSPPGGAEATIGDDIYVVLEEAPVASPPASPEASPPASPEASPPASPEASPEASPAGSPEASPDEPSPAGISDEQAGSSQDASAGVGIVLVAALVAVLAVAGWATRSHGRKPAQDHDHRRVVRCVPRADPSPSVEIRESHERRPKVRVQAYADQGRQEIREGMS
ncbi:PASTA domain-containing protein [Microbispora sp. NPDC049125]|uniref:PASTA domain-containing protein n=1 Tax=Microbispora sp. NPDC049125 TaxID=3154929 RepID=UPI003465C15B